MNSYKVKGIILAVILSLASIMMPFSVYADSISLSNINGVSVTLDEITFIENVQYSVQGGTLTVQRNFFTYKGEIQFDKSYLGYVDISYKYYFTGRNDSGPVTYNQTKTQKIFVNGDKAYFTFSFIANSSVDPLSYTTSYLTINSSDLIEYGIISDIQTIIDILLENQDIITDIYSELQTVVSNTSLSNYYLETISKLRQYNVNPASYGWLTYLFNNNFLVAENTKIYYLNYPVYNISANKQIFWTVNLGNDTSQKLWLFFATNRYFTQSSINTIFNLNNFNVEHVSFLDTYKPIFIYRVCLSGNYENNQSANYVLNTIIDIPNFIPFSAGVYRSNDINQIFPFDTELAIFLGVNNKELSYLNIIANGTNQSNSAASDLESEASEYSEIADDVIGVEEGLTSNFETEVNKIDLDTGLNVFGGNFMTSATWVRNQFDRLTENTPYGSLVVYGLTLGFALLMLGKVFL